MMTDRPVYLPQKKKREEAEEEEAAPAEVEAEVPKKKKKKAEEPAEEVAEDDAKVGEVVEYQQSGWDLFMEASDSALLHRPTLP